MTVSNVDLHVLMEAAFKKVATGKELKYFWNNNDDVVKETRQDIVKTLCRLAAAEETDEKVETNAGSYDVDKYSVPNKQEWLTTLLSFSGKVYLTPVQRTRQQWMATEVRKNDWENLPGDVLSPKELKKACEAPGDYNDDWTSFGEITKEEIAFSDLHGMFTGTGDEYVVFDYSKDALFAQILGLKCKDMKSFGAKYEVLETQKALVKAMTSGEGKDEEQDTFKAEEQGEINDGIRCEHE